jgi:hypothetical protein
MFSDGMDEPQETEVHLVGKLEGKTPLAKYSMMGDRSKTCF